MTDGTDPRQGMPMPSWLAPTLVAALAIPIFIAFWAGGRPELGVLWGGVQLACALVLAGSTRWDSVRILAGVDDDERTRLIGYQAATAITVVWTVCLVALFLTAAVRGESGLIYGVLLVVGEVTQLVTIAVISRRQ